MEFKEVVEDRYSCKKFNGEPVAEKALKAILEAGRVAPTAKNLQEQHVYVVQSPEKLALIDELTPCRYSAPTVLVVAFNKENVFTYPGGTRNSGIEDAAIVATHMMLAAKNAGVDSCWVNFFNGRNGGMFGPPGETSDGDVRSGSARKINKPSRSRQSSAPSVQPISGSFPIDKAHSYAFGPSFKRERRPLLISPMK